jgi:cardiolipin synthase
MTNPTKWTLYSENGGAWHSMLADCANAKTSIVLEQFIFVNDEFGQRLLDICKERAANGVKIRFLWDAAGSFTFWGSNIVEELKKAGIELLFWKTLVPSYFKMPNFRSWYFRNHRRTLVIDGKIGYTGSICVDNNFKNWRDTNVRLEGPVVPKMENAFEQMWARAQKTKLPRRSWSLNAEFRYVTNYPAPGRRHVYAELVKAIRRARNHIYITTPYFVPTHRLVHALKVAAGRGVDIRLIVPERSDHYIVDLGARAYFKTLLQSGIRIFLYKGNMIHSKAVIVDGTWSTIGSMNLDSASLLYNFEANIVTTNDDFAHELTGHFMKDTEESKEVLLKDWQNRFFVEKIPEILVHLIKRFL